MDIKTRKELGHSKGLCRNCLSSRHMVAQCISEARCKKCGQQHHTLLCERATNVYVAPQTQLNPAATSFVAAEPSFEETDHE